MTLDEAGVSSYVSDYVDSERTVRERPDCPHVQVAHSVDDPTASLPGLVEEPGASTAHDVLVRDEMTQDGNRPLISSDAGIAGPELAVEVARELAEEYDVLIWDTILRYKQPESVREVIFEDYSRD